MYENKIYISVVIPVYKSEDCLEELVKKITEAFAQAGHDHEIVLVNDCSPDKSWEKICELAGRYHSIRGINLRKNAGQDNALMAGLRIARGCIVVIMDDDLQHDPADAEKLIKKIEGGFDVCYANFPRKNQAWWKNVGSWFNDRVANIVVRKPKKVYLSPYKAIAREVVEEIIKYDGPYPYVDGLIMRVTENITQVEVEHHNRYSGESSYDLMRSISVWLKLATSFSLVPLRIATYLGFVFSTFGFLLALFYVLRKLTGSQPPIGWASTIVVILVLGGVQLACVGLIGEYVGRIFLHLNKRPQYVIRDSIRVNENHLRKSSQNPGQLAVKTTKS